MDFNLYIKKAKKNISETSLTILHILCI